MWGVVSGGDGDHEADGVFPQLHESWSERMRGEMFFCFFCFLRVGLCFRGTSCDDNSWTLKETDEVGRLCDPLAPPSV